MFLNEMQVGKSIEIFVYRSGYKYRLVSKLEDVNEDNFSISLIANRTKVFHFQDTDKIEIIYRINHQLWRWKNLRAKVIILDGSRVHHFTLTGSSEGEKFNRRNAFRVFMGEDITLTYYVMNLVEKKTEDSEYEEDTLIGEIEYETKHCLGFIKDLSENGVGIFSNNVFNIGDELEFILDTPFGMLKCKAEVVRTTRESHGLYQNFYGCIFTTTSKNLVKYIYTLQRKRLGNMKG
ncbi:PilZ domain-containing protein [Mobilisporobacter senegalensis]|uniref:PilZ domain-containing protein n=1 Tax=Mobilisporobacter senegalensis TaxID=1329262 RepID=A0A3N1XWZ6_9FIRM|nr:PilZ domain-containing protein [Mobilisporobacter senegalensis]ROR30731.1 PilZ domain-containing protein [Mobilisporobacter senegalensis]